MTWMRSVAIVVGALLLVAVDVSRAAAAESTAPSPASDNLDMQQLGEELQQGHFTSVIDRLELLSDQGRVHPDLSFNRGVAYLARAESSAAEERDLFQAAAAFHEAALLDPDDAEAASAARAVQELVSKRLARERGERVAARPRFLRALVSLTGELLWSVLAAVGSLLLSLGLALHWWLPDKGRSISLPVAVVGAALAAVGLTMAVSARDLRVSYTPAVALQPEMQLLDEAGQPLRREQPQAAGERSDRVLGGALVFISETRGNRVRVESGDREGWLPTRNLRRLATAP